MACPAGYGPKDVEKADSQDSKLYTKTPVYPTILEPVEIKKYTDDAIYLMGGQFAILCQFAHPGLARGSYEHSNFASRLMNRLKTTARFMNAAIYGTMEEKQAIFSVIHASHTPVKGEGYTADDVELHKWTAATLFMALVVVHQAFFGKMSRETMEVLYKESAVYGTSLRMPPEEWPKTLDDFWVYWNHNIQTLEITHWAKSLCKDLLYPKKIPFILKPMRPIMRLLTEQWVPERLAREYGFRNTPFRLGLYHYVCGYFGIVYPHLPKKLKTLPSRYYMKDLKKAVKQIEARGTWDR